MSNNRASTFVLIISSNFSILHSSSFNHDSSGLVVAPPKGMMLFPTICKFSSCTSVRLELSLFSLSLLFPFPTTDSNLAFPTSALAPLNVNVLFVEYHRIEISSVS